MSYHSFFCLKSPTQYRRSRSQYVYYTVALFSLCVSLCCLKDCMVHNSKLAHVAQLVYLLYYYIANLTVVSEAETCT